LIVGRRLAQQALDLLSEATSEEMALVSIALSLEKIAETLTAPTARERVTTQDTCQHIWEPSRAGYFVCKPCGLPSKREVFGNVRNPNAASLDRQARSRLGCTPALVHCLAAYAVEVEDALCEALASLYVEAGVGKVSLEIWMDRQFNEIGDRTRARAASADPPVFNGPVGGSHGEARSDG
jgi:hypothetical protein